MQNKKIVRKSIFFINTFLFVIAVVFALNTFSVSGHQFIQRALAAVGNITGEGTVNYLARFAVGANPSNQIGDSIIYDSGTNVGIGTATPGVKLDVTGTIQSLTTFQSSSGADLRLNANGVNRDVFLQVNGSTLMTIQGSTGNVGIGTATPVVKLAVNGSIALPEGSAIYSDNGGGLSAGGRLIYRESVSDVIHIGTPNYGNALYIDPGVNVGGAPVVINPSGGNVGIGTATPGAKLDVRGTASVDPLRLGDAISTFRIGPGVGVAGGFNFYDDDAASVRLRINDTGDVGIGTASPGAKLEVNGGMKLTPLAADPSSLTNGMMWMRQ